MRRPKWTVFGAALVLATSIVVSPPPAPAAPPAAGPGLDVYQGTLDRAQWQRLSAGGVDLQEAGRGPAAGAKTTVELVLTRDQAARLVAAGVPLRVKPATKRMRATAQSPSVFRPYSGPGGIREELATTAARFPHLAKLETIGYSLRGQPIQAVKVTAGARTVPDGRRPAVLYFGAQHAREWITPEMVRRLMHHVLDGYGADPAITRLLGTTELWFMPVANPDGYDITFTGDEFRYVRKNLRDNNGDGVFGPEDGVDLNRNFAEKWNYDNEGSSDDPHDDTYRGPAPESEPETKALDGLLGRIGFRFLINYHSAAELLLWGSGWQVSTVNPDDQISMALSGDHANSAVPGYQPMQSAQMYTTNGDTDTHAQARYGTIGFAAEMSTCQTASASEPDDQWEPDDCRTEFDFPDDEKLIQAEYQKNVPFALSVARSAGDPADPVSVVGRRTGDLVPGVFADSFGAGQQVSVIAKRSLRDVRLHYKINNGSERTAAVCEFRGGERYGGTGDKYFAELRGTVVGQRPKDRVRVWFTARGGKASEPFGYTVADRIGGDVLVLATEDVTGINPPSTDGATSARFADEHVDALRHAGYRADVYDMDTHGGRAPDALGVLSHYRAVVWETGDNVMPRKPGQPDFTTTRAEVETELAVRDYLNEGGKLLYAGQYAAYAESNALYQPDGPTECLDLDDLTCQYLGDDFRQYWLGAGIYVDDGGHQAVGVTGRSGVFSGLTAPVGAQQHTASFMTTSSQLPVAQFPQFTSTAPMIWKRDAPGPLDPIDGDWYLFDGQSSLTALSKPFYKRLTRTVDLTAAHDAHLRFKFSRSTAGDDFTFVEAHEAGTDNWTTLPDAGGHTTTDNGFDCQFDGFGPHPFLAHYWGTDCGPKGTTGTWNAATDDSGGWQTFDADLSAYAGKRVEISISELSDGFSQGFGAFLDDVRVDVDGATVTRTSFESDLGGWMVGGPPPGSPDNPVNWMRSRQAYDLGAATATADTLYLGFGLEKMPASDRNDLMARAMRHLLPSGHRRSQS
ncbi:M14 family zinc carboxypeptidase [Actinoplanes sp. KI2]|uniref:M14 family metallopeptidase n=1 Tax=Actinoplanes sp. KI2 TaxID=2983315 RepID=UPI0021D5D3AA|nr:M14 family metallopeptidase [Actinoplanes sp. KI2]MCU7723987.1 M14 family zinc carboxypeptidase [Actinoplanes sp. KI2]